MSKTLKIDPSKIINTLEQDAILDRDYQDGECIAIKAFAGTGKTTTLQLLAHVFFVKNPQTRILYLAYNKSIQTEAQKKFGPNVVCRTTHSMAWADFGSKYRHKLNNIRLTDVVNILGYSHLHKWQQARIVLKTVAKFCQSAEREFEEKHISKNSACPFDSAIILNDAIHLWVQMKDVNNTNIAMTHDGYLKLYQLSKPYLKEKFDIILFDECQDANDLTLDLVNTQNMLKFFVGDDHQQIYQWRGSKNAFSKIESDHMFYLTHSFRFGSNIANLANVLLHEYTNEKNSLIGRKPTDEICEEFDDDDKICIITRSNSKLFIKCLESIKNDKTISIVGGLDKGIDFQTIMDVYNLWRDDKYQIKDKFFSGFSDWSDYVAYAKGSEEGDLLRMKALIEKHRSEIPSLIKLIRENHTTASKADMILTTCHKSKGLEFDCVELADDFVDLAEIQLKQNTISKEEINILYVGLTRAIRKLKMNKNIKYLLLDKDERKN